VPLSYLPDLLDRNQTSAARKNLSKYIGMYFVVLRFACAAIDLAINATFPGGSTQTKHFIHDVKQQCLSGVSQKETCSKV